MNFIIFVRIMPIEWPLFSILFSILYLSMCTKNNSFQHYFWGPEKSKLMYFFLIYCTILTKIVYMCIWIPYLLGCSSRRPQNCEIWLKTYKFGRRIVCKTSAYCPWGLIHFCWIDKAKTFKNQLVSERDLI